MAPLPPLPPPSRSGRHPDPAPPTLPGTAFPRHRAAAAADWRGRPSQLRRALPVLALCLAAGCRPGRDPGALLGWWQNGPDRVEFLPGGEVRFHSALGTRSGTYAQLSPAEIRVDLGARWPSGEPRYWRAMARGDQLGLCEVHTGRHCMRFARPGSRVGVLPR